MAGMLNSINVDGNIVHNILTCYGCSEHINKAVKRLLKCKHYFCEKCMDGFKKITCQENGTIGTVCPLCSSFHTRDEIAAIPEEIMRILQKIDEKSPKDAGLPEKENIHPDKSDGTLKVSQAKEVDCKNHQGQTLELICLDCNEMICFECKVDSHKEHNSDIISESIRAYFQKAGPILDEISLYLEHQKHQITTLGKQSLSIKNNQKVTKAQIQAHKDNIIQEFASVVNRKFEEMTKEIDQKAENQIMEVESMKDSINQSIKSEESILNWVKFVKSDAPPSFALEELRTGLFERLEQLKDSVPNHESKRKVAMIEFIPSKVEIPKSIDLGKMTLQETVAVESPYVSRRNQTGNINYRKVQFNLKTLSTKVGRVEKTVKINIDSCRLCVFQEKFWIPCPDTSSINVFPVDSDAESVETIMDLGDVTKPRSLHPISRDLLMLAADSGLYVMNDNGHTKEKIHRGKFCDVFANNDSQIAALEWIEKKVYIFSKNNLSHAPISFDVELGGGKNFASTICIHNAYIYISSSAKNVILKYNMQGTLVEEFGISGKAGCGELNMPSLCVVDPMGDLLIADSGNHRLQVLSGSGQWSLLRLKIFKPQDVVIIRSTMYILHSEGNKISIYPL